MPSVMYVMRVSFGASFRRPGPPQRSSGRPESVLERCPKPDREWMRICHPSRVSGQAESCSLHARLPCCGYST